MKLKIIETEDYVLAVSDTQPTKDEVYLHKPSDKVGTVIERVRKADFYKVIAYQPKNNTPELDLPLLSEIVVEDDVERLAEQFVKTNLKRSSQAAGVMIGFIEGYKAATKIYSEEDLRKALNKGEELSRLFGNNKLEEREGFIHSLKKSTPKWFVAEMEKVFYTANMPKENEDRPAYRLKTETKNNKSYLIGKYLYE
jgi:hypothetical protein